ncbi:MAG: hypothetical protein H6907_09620 [Hyphomicrobiales bacterium]|nr:hypothetical protein [Hyphomicrobiales bacterium]MCP5371977.1 hypothetical protein [Hyphomicrobiales bacterium]
MIVEILSKVLATGTIVLALSLVAERLSTRLAGLVSGAPLGTLLVFSFLALTKDGDFIAATVPHGLAALLGTLAFTFGYHLGIGAGGRLELPAATLCGLAGYAAVALAFEPVDISMPVALALALAGIAVTTRLFRRIETVAVLRAVRLTPWVLTLRAGLAAVVVVAVIAVAEWGGTAVTGVLLGFPMTLWPTYLIVHATYGRGPVRTMIRNFPLGLGGLVTFLVVVYFTAPDLGPYPAIGLGLAAALAYLALLSKLTQRRPG